MIFYLLIVSPIGFYLFFRVLLPLYWCINWIYNNSSSSYVDIVLFHVLYLFIDATLILILLRYIIKKTYKYRIFIYINHFKIRQKKYITLGIFIAFSLIIWLFFNYNSLPIFLNKGSDSIVLLAEKFKIKIWISFNLLKVLLILLMFIVVLINNYRIKILYLIILFLFYISSGKKSALISALLNCTFLYFLLRKIKINIKLLIFILLGTFTAVLFGVIQYQRTILGYVNINELFQNFTNIFILGIKIFYISSTVYLEQFINLEGIKYAENYSQSLGNLGIFKYFLNPFLKFFFGTGIDKAIGPYLNYLIYGSNFPNGVNPTLFFEIIFIFGSKYACFFSFPILILLFLFQRNAINKVLVYTIKGNIFFAAFWYLVFIWIFSFKVDTLNSIRNLPFMFLLPVTYKIIKILKNIANRRVKVERTI